MHQPIEGGSWRQVPPRLVANTVFWANRKNYNPDVEKPPRANVSTRRLAKRVFHHPVN
jgi:hypothetical protein